MQTAKKIHKRRIKAFTKTSREAYLDSRISAGPPFLLSLQQFISARPSLLENQEISGKTLIKEETPEIISAHGNSMKADSLK